MVKQNGTQGAGVSLHHLALQHWLGVERQNHHYDAGSDPLFGTFLRAQSNQQRFRFLRAWMAANWDEGELVSAAELSASLDKAAVMRKLANASFDEVAKTVIRVQNADRDMAAALGAWKELLNGPAASEVSEREGSGDAAQREQEPGVRDSEPGGVKVRGVGANSRGPSAGVRS